MKFLLVLIFCVSVSLSGRAQSRVILMRDTTRLGLSVAKLEQAYPPALARKPGEKGLFARSGQQFLDTLNTVYQSFFQFVEDNKRRLPASGIMVQTNEFVRPDGSYALVLCNFSGKELTSQQEAQFLQLVTEWYEKHTFPIRTEAGFRWQNFRQLGSVPQQRLVRRGPGIISTLEAAEATTRPDTVTMLAFNQLDLPSVPELVYRFPKLQELDLSKNDLHELPARLTADIPTLKRLSVLYNHIPNDSVFVTRNKRLLSLNLQGNKLTRIPRTLRQNRRLESLWLGNNKLAGVDIKTLKKLRWLNDLNLYNVGLTSLPKGIKRLKHVKVLDLYYNKLTSLPPQLGRMKRLEQLALSYNDLSELPPTLTRLRHLEKLYAHHNRISQLPNGFEKLTNLRVLDLSNNWITIVPPTVASLPALEDLNLGSNNIQEFPVFLSGMPTLRKLFIRANPITETDALAGPYAPVIKRMEANKTEVLY